jgi:glycosyltransferase involved in cell wall biosynthesis
MPELTKLNEAESQGGAECSPRPQAEVVCVCSGHGFPLTSTANRIINIGKALKAAGIGFRLLHCGPSPVPLNTKRSGVYQGIPFEYTACVRRPKNKLVRWLVYAWAVTGLTVRLLRIRRTHPRVAVYRYVMEGPICLYVGWACRWLKLPVVQELCEWLPSHAYLRPSAFTKWLYRKQIFAQATGILVISRMLERIAGERAAAANPGLLIHRLPNIVDSQRFVNADPYIDDAGAQVPHFLWCGVGYLKDIRFLIRALARVNKDGHRSKLRVISAAYQGWTPEQLRDYAVEQGLPRDSIVPMGCVDDRTLEGCYKSAAGLLLPLWDDVTSRTRMPNKLAEYLASGRPVVASKVGDLTEFLADGVNAYLSEPGDERMFAGKMLAILLNPARATQIGAAGQETCIQHLDYRSQVDGLAKFFTDCIERPRQAKEWAHAQAA